MDGHYLVLEFCHLHWDHITARRFEVIDVRFVGGLLVLTIGIAPWVCLAGRPMGRSTSVERCGRRRRPY